MSGTCKRCNGAVVLTNGEYRCVNCAAEYMVVKR